MEIYFKKRLFLGLSHLKRFPTPVLNIDINKSVSVDTNRWGGPGRVQGTAEQIGTFWCHDWQSERCNRNSVSDRKSWEIRQRSGQWTQLLLWGAQDMWESWVDAVTCLSISRRAYLMLGSCKVMAGLLLEKNSLKIRLMMLSKPPRISCGVK